jgi:hypothetical protein
MGIFSKRRWVRVAIQDEAGHTVFDDRIERMTLPEDVILSLCLEFFADPAPCEIHRGAAVSRALSEIELHGAGQFLAEALPERLRRCFGGYDACQVTVEIHEK